MRRRRRAAGALLAGSGALAALAVPRAGQAPDDALALAACTTTLSLVAMGDRRRARRRPWVPIAQAGALAAQAGVAGAAAARRTPPPAWALLARGAAAAALPFSLPEARAAWRWTRPAPGGRRRARAR